MLTAEDRSRTSGRSECPESGAVFEWTQDVSGSAGQVLIDINGNPYEERKYSVTGDEK